MPQSYGLGQDLAGGNLYSLLYCLVTVAIQPPGTASHRRRHVDRNCSLDLVSCQNGPMEIMWRIHLLEDSSCILDCFLLLLYLILGIPAIKK